MQQIDDPKFNALLWHVYTGFLIDTNITNLNSKLVTNFPFHDLLKNTIIV